MITSGPAEPSADGPPPNRLLDALGGGRLLEFDPQRSLARLQFTGSAAMCHGGGSVQGGFVTAWLDSAMAHAAILAEAGARVPVSLELKVTFLRPTLPGRMVVAQGWIVRSGWSTAFLEGRLLGADDVLLATASMTARMLPVAPG